MRIKLITPAGRRSRTGNRTTATRWARLLREAGHRVAVAQPHTEESDNTSGAEAMIALHAWRSAPSIRAFSERHPKRALIVALTGTDVYRFQQSHPDTCLESMARAHVLLGLHDRLGDDIPPEFRDKLYTVYQSAPVVRGWCFGGGSGNGGSRRFRALVVGHLREEKDPLRAAYAARDVPAESRLQVVSAGRALTPEWAEAAEAEMARNPRFTWRGELAAWRVRRLMTGAHVLVISSRMEGGANVVSEACVLGLPVLASDIPGNRGLLGEEYPAYYPVEDTAAMRELLLRAERDESFRARLREHCTSRAVLFRPDAERAALERALASAVAAAAGVQAVRGLTV